MVQNRSKNMARAEVHILTDRETYYALYHSDTRFRAVSGGPRSPLRFEEAFKGGRGIQGGKFWTFDLKFMSDLGIPMHKITLPPVCNFD